MSVRDSVAACTGVAGWLMKRFQLKLAAQKNAIPAWR